MTSFLMLGALAVALPSPIPVDASRLAPQYFVNDHGCVASKAHPQGWSTPLQVSNPNTGFAYLDDIQRARYAEWKSRYAEAATLYQRAMKETILTGVSLDAMIRQPYSIALFRAGDASSAKAQWRILERQNVPIDLATREAIAGDFQTALTDYARTLGHTSANPMFLDSGALYNLQRGLNAAAEAKYGDARTYLGFAVECSQNLDAPHLALGLIRAMNGEVSEANREWLLALEGVVPVPPPPLGISQAQSDALTLLLHYN